MWIHRIKHQLVPCPPRPATGEQARDLSVSVLELDRPSESPCSIAVCPRSAAWSGHRATTAGPAHGSEARADSNANLRSG